MKKLVFSAILTVLSVVAFAAKSTIGNDDVNKITYTAKQHLEQEFEKAEGVKWSVTREFQKASFTLDGKKITAIYDVVGNFLGATQAVAFDQIPVRAKLDIEKKYKGYYFSDALLVISRPDNSDSYDVGTYWVEMSNNKKELYLKVSPAAEVALVKVVK